MDSSCCAVGKGKLCFVKNCCTEGIQIELSRTTFFSSNVPLSRYRIPKLKRLHRIYRDRSIAFQRKLRISRFLCFPKLLFCRRIIKNIVHFEKHVRSETSNINDYSSIQVQESLACIQKNLTGCNLDCVLQQAIKSTKYGYDFANVINVATLAQCNLVAQMI